MGGQHHDPAVLPPGNTRYPSYRRMGGPQGRSGHVQIISPPPGHMYVLFSKCSYTAVKISSFEKKAKFAVRNVSLVIPIFITW
jgi:hypothetical protein